MTLSSPAATGARGREDGRFGGGNGRITASTSRAESTVAVPAAAVPFALRRCREPAVLAVLRGEQREGEPPAAARPGPTRRWRRP